MVEAALTFWTSSFLATLEEVAQEVLAAQEVDSAEVSVAVDSAGVVLAVAGKHLQVGQSNYLQLILRVHDFKDGFKCLIVVILKKLFNTLSICLRSL